VTEVCAVISKGLDAIAENQTLYFSITN